MFFKCLEKHPFVGTSPTSRKLIAVLGPIVGDRSGPINAPSNERFLGSVYRCRFDPSVDVTNEAIPMEGIMSRSN
jgi:hypothetical protein